VLCGSQSSEAIAPIGCRPVNPVALASAAEWVQESAARLLQGLRVGTAPNYGSSHQANGMWRSTTTSACYWVDAQSQAENKISSELVPRSSIKESAAPIPFLQQFTGVSPWVTSVYRSLRSLGKAFRHASKRL